MDISRIVQKIKPSATIAAAAKAKELKSKGVDVLEFTLGEPDFTTPAHICDAAKAAMDAGKTHYTPSAGLLDVRQAIADAYKRDHRLTYDPQDIVVSNGAKHSIHNALMALCNPGDEVIIPAPYWVSYSDLVELTGATPVVLSTREEDNFCLQAEAFEAAINDKTRLVMLNSPCNPTGSVYPVELLETLCRIATDKGVHILSDEIYEKLMYEGSEFRSAATFGDDIRQNTIIVNGVSKAYAMTGWRIGWTLSPTSVAKAMDKLQSQETSCPSSISQLAAKAALSGPQDCVEEMRLAFVKRRAYVLERLAAMPDISLPIPGGAFYAFFNVSRYFGKTLQGGVNVDNATDFCTALLEQAHVATVTGDAFGAPGFLRLSFATDLDTLARGMDALEGFLKG
ncbi:MAG TPA: pyridoxal phosphate-dependent aminotransferase [Planctomycetaceae bacterium]|nr:pyridoxal phosphate-dependent aminotransferase [Planctomycetaceae bacterium]